MEIPDTKKHKKNLPRFFCETCDFKCYMKCDWDRHIVRPKHIKEIKKLTKTYTCLCGKNFLSNSGLWKHKQICNEKDEFLKKEVIQINTDNNTSSHTNEIDELKEFMKYLMKENSDMKSMMMKVIENGTCNNSNNTTTTTTN